MAFSTELLLFAVDGQRYALPIASVERLVRAAEITPLPEAPQVVLGVLDFEGTILPVFSLRRRLTLPDRELRITDQFIIAQTGKRKVALVIDEARDIVSVSSEKITAAGSVVAGLENIQGVASMEEGLVLIQDIEKFLSSSEEAVLDTALRKKEAPSHGV